MEAVLKYDTVQWDNLFKKLFAKMRDPKPYMKTAYATIGFKDIIDHFSTESGPDGRWAPLKYRKGAILQDTGNLRKSILPSNAKDAGATGIMVFANAPYGGYHNEGTVNIPERKFMWLSESAKKDMAQMIANLIVESL